MTHYETQLAEKRRHRAEIVCASQKHFESHFLAKKDKERVSRSQMGTRETLSVLRCGAVLGILVLFSTKFFSRNFRTFAEISDRGDSGTYVSGRGKFILSELFPNILPLFFLSEVFTTLFYPKCFSVGSFFESFFLSV